MHKTLPIELINVKLVRESKKNENTVEIHEMRTAFFEFASPLALNIE